ncbi:Putative ribonuclease H protein At1g65750, partial [Linum grandiflorum]
HFLWLANHERLLTNSERSRRHLTSSADCHRCLALCESTLSHVFWDYSFTLAIWQHLHFPGLTAPGWALPWRKWLEFFLTSDNKLCFGITLWFLWKFRNGRIFAGDNTTPASAAAKIQAWTRNVIEALKRDDGFADGRQTRSTVEIRWTTGPPGWVSLNTDGSVNPADGRAAAGGLIRDELGRCHCAFSLNLGRCSITRAEMCGLIDGLHRAWGMGFRRVAAYLDSQAALTLLQQPGDINHGHQAEVLAFRELQDRDWVLTLQHSFREANRAADFLADLGRRLPLGGHNIPVSDPKLAPHLLYDVLGLSEPRSIPIS